jgi:hypothetical protein
MLRHLTQSVIRNCLKCGLHVGTFHATNFLTVMHLLCTVGLFGAYELLTKLVNKQTPSGRRRKQNTVVPFVLLDDSLPAKPCKTAELC